MSLTLNVGHSCSSHSNGALPHSSTAGCRWQSCRSAAVKLAINLVSSKGRITSLRRRAHGALQLGMTWVSLGTALGTKLLRRSESSLAVGSIGCRKEQEKLLNSARYKQHLEQLENLGKQCSSNLAPDPQKVLARVEQQQQRREQLSAPELMLIMYSLWLSAMSSLPYDSLEAAESVQMVLMLIFFFGFIPPQRESVILSLQLPGSKCMHPNCQHRDKCLGNHIRACVGDSDRLELFVQHYKGDKHKGYVPLQVPLPPEICALYQAHLGSGRDLIIDSTVGLETVEAEAVAPYLFIWPSTLKPISMAQVHKVFNQLVLSDSDLSFGVQWLRTVFVEHMRAVGSAACGLDESAAARMMGHHIGVWNVAYDKFKQHRSSAHVEQVMPVWRGKLLQQQGGSDLLEQGKQALLANGFKD